jgi:hypothetical protein
MQRSVTEMASYVGIGCTRNPVVGAWKASGMVCPGALECINGTYKNPTVKPRLLSQTLDFLPSDSTDHDFRSALVMFQSDSEIAPNVCVRLPDGTQLTTKNIVMHGPAQCNKQSLFTVTIQVPKNVIGTSDSSPLCVTIMAGEVCSCSQISLG